MEQRDYTFPGRTKAQVAVISKRVLPFRDRRFGGVIAASRVEKTGYLSTTEGEQYAVIGDMAVVVEEKEGGQGLTLYPQARFNQHFTRGKGLTLEHTVDEVEPESVEEVEDVEDTPEPVSEPDSEEKAEETEETTEAVEETDTESVVKAEVEEPSPVSKKRKSTKGKKRG